MARLRQDLDLSGRGRPTGVARLVLVLLMLHGDALMYSWPGRERLAKLAGCSEAAVRKALRLLEERDAIERRVQVIRGRTIRGWIVVLEPEDIDGPCVRQHVFWPRPTHGRGDTAQTTAVRALVAAGIGRSRIAAILMLFQFARTPTIPTLAADSLAHEPLPPNRAWIARVLGMSVATVYKAEREALARGLAMKGKRGMLCFVDPELWPLLLGCPDLAPLAPVECPSEAANDPAYASGTIEPSPDVSSADTRARVEPGADTRARVEPGPSVAVPAGALLELELAARGLTVVDDLGREILCEAARRWGIEPTRARLAELLAGPDPTYALESLGHALGPEFECPRQLVPTCPDPDTLPDSDKVDRAGAHGPCYARPRHVCDFPDRAPPFAGPAE